MEHKKKKELRIRSCLTGAIWLALAFSMLISALLFAFLNHFLDLPGKIPGLGWLLIFNTLIAGLITSFINAKLLEPITRLSKAMKAVSQGDFEQHLETNSRVAEIGESYHSFNVMTKELRATEMLQMDFVSNVSHEFKTPINAIEGYTMLLQGDELSQEQEGYVEKILFNTQRLSGLVGNILLLSRLENQNIPMKKTKYRLDEQIRQAFLSLEDKWTEKGIGFQVEMEEIRYVGNEDVLPDDRKMLSERMAEIADSGTAELILTTGGTGFSPRDITPEATEDIIDRRVPGIPEAMRAYSMTITKRAMLSRSTAGIRKKTLIINLPGSPKAVKESLEYIIDALGHGIEIMTGEAGNCAR